MFPEGVAGAFFWMLLPIAAASGWLAAQRSRDIKELKQRSRRHTSRYFRGLNYLLNEQPDKAIEVFTSMLDVEPEVIETQLALGSLFRRRGEVDRAISIHSNVMTAVDLDDEQRAMVLMELGLDYLRAGLFDRAESLYTELKDVPAYRSQALRHLVDIYQQERDWHQAIACAEQLQASSGQDHRTMLGHFRLELAQQVRMTDPELCRKYIEQSLAVDPHSVRARFMLGELAEADGDYASAIQYYRRVAESAPEFTPDALAALSRCFRQANDEAELESYLRDLALRNPHTAIWLMLADLRRHAADNTEAITCLEQAMQLAPSLQAVHRLVACLGVQGDPQQSADIALVERFLDHLVQEVPGYICDNCGYRSKAPYWQCPTCKSWDTVKPNYANPAIGI